MEKYYVKMTENICRICLRKPKTKRRFVSVHDHCENLDEDQTFAELFQKTCGFCIEVGEPQIFCEDCRSELIQCFEFIQKCKRTQDHLKGFISVPDVFATDIKIEKIEDEEEIEIPAPSNEINGSEAYANSHESDDCIIQDKVYQMKEDDRALDDQTRNSIDFVDQTDDSDNENQMDLNETEKPTENSNPPKDRCNFCNGKFACSYIEGHKLVCKLNPMSDHGCEIDMQTWIKCEHCREPVCWFKSLDIFKRHLLVIHKFDKSAKCQYCSKQCYPDTLKFHEEDCKMNPNNIEKIPERQVMCPHCGKLLRSTYIDAHIETVHANKEERLRYVCDLCPNVSFFSKDVIRKHMTTVHLMQEISGQHLCTVCGATFKSQNNLDYHNRKEHTELFEWFTCSKCPFKSPHKKQIKDHYLRHLGDAAKSYVCHICDRKFFQSHMLARHMASHSTDRNFKCDLCSSSFKTSKALRVHKRGVHASEKAYECPVCNRGFATNQNNRLHIKKEHPEYELPPPGTVMKKNPSIVFKNLLKPASSS